MTRKAIHWTKATALLVFLPLMASTLARAVDEPVGVEMLPLDTPFTFSYLAWEKRARIEASEVVLAGPGLTPKGGAGVVVPLNLIAHANDTPALRVKIGPTNTLKTLKFLLRDQSGKTGTWFFHLPPAAEQPAIALAEDAAPLATPNEKSDPAAPDLAKIMQWQMIGDWSSDGPVDVRVQAVLSVKPDKQILARRQELKRRDEQAQEQARQDRRSAREKYGTRSANSPVLEKVYAAAPDLLALQIREGRLTPCKLTTYEKQPGDVPDDQNGKQPPHLMRGGNDLGMLIGPTHRETGLVSFEQYSGDPLLTAEADDAGNFKITSTDDTAFATAQTPLQVTRKSKPDDWQQPTLPGIVVLHRLYLRLPSPMRPGKSYTIDVGALNTRDANVTFTHSPQTNWTESVHVNQLGFRPDDPLKHAYLSLWTGTGNGEPFDSNTPFSLVDATTAKPVYHGKLASTWPADKPEKMHQEKNFNSCPVSLLDFSDFKTPGTYRVVVDKIGCSYPFQITPDAWNRAFSVQMKGFYNQRSGVPLGPPFTDFVRPTCWKPGENDCLPITQSTYCFLDPDPAHTLANGDTAKPVPEAWGGFHDAGDWNPRRITHMSTTTLWQLELLQLFPEFFQHLALNIPNDAPGPDLLKECLFELSLYRRLQLRDGSVRFGIETDGDPVIGEASWKQHMPAYVYAPDMLSSYIYAAVAARAADVLKAYDPKLSDAYRQSAIAAMQWAEADRTAAKTDGRWQKYSAHTLEITSNRNLAAVNLLSLTHDPKWNAIYLDETPLKAAAAHVFFGDDTARTAAFAYARLPEVLADPTVKANARQSLVADADGTIAYQQNNAFGIASSDPGKPQFLGFYSTPHGAVSLLRAHYLTRDSRYIAAALHASLFSAGANPSNIVYTSGLGASPVKALNLDAIATGQSPPVGLTPYGNIDLSRWHDNWITWPITYFLNKHATPSIYQWPTTEAYFDVRSWPSLCEFCTDQTMGPNSYVWGYLAARP